MEKSYEVKSSDARKILEWWYDKDLPLNLTIKATMHKHTKYVCIKGFMTRSYVEELSKVFAELREPNQ